MFLVQPRTLVTLFMLLGHCDVYINKVDENIQCQESDSGLKLTR
jgi:hypothetical protein